MMTNSTRRRFRPSHASLVKARTRRLYMLLIEREFRHAVELQTKDGTGAAIFVAWAKSKSGRNVFKIADISHSDQAMANIEKCIMERAMTNRIDLFGRRKSQGTTHTQLAA